MSSGHESKQHIFYKNKVKDDLLKQGFQETEISFEHIVYDKNTNGKKRVDVVGISLSLKVAYEIGSVRDINKRKQFLNLFFDHVHILSYKQILKIYGRMPKEGTNINKTLSLDSDIYAKFITKFGHGHVSEKIRDAMDMYYENEIKKEVKKT